MEIHITLRTVRHKSSNWQEQIWSIYHQNNLFAAGISCQTASDYIKTSTVVIKSGIIEHFFDKSTEIGTFVIFYICKLIKKRLVPIAIDMVFGSHLEFKNGHLPNIWHISENICDRSTKSGNIYVANTIRC